MRPPVAFIVVTCGVIRLLPLPREQVGDGRGTKAFVPARLARKMVADTCPTIMMLAAAVV